MLLPYNVDRPARRASTVTYALMALNIAVYLLTVGYTNVRLYSDRPAFDDKVAQMRRLIEKYGGDPDEILPADIRQQSGTRLQQGAPPGSGAGEAPSAEEFRRRFKAEFDAIVPPEQSDSFAWSRQHRRDALVLEIHPDVTRLLGYTPGRPSAWGLLSAMFLHADLDHLAGNMLFLWVFGRAVEDTLGHGLFAGAYFVCGFAATLLHHIMALALAPAVLLVPVLGASGAVAGVQGLFAPRFYGTPVRVFYTTWRGLPVFYIALPILGAMLGRVFAGGFGLGSPGFTLATILLLAWFVLAGNETLWGEWRVKAAWLIACWVGFFDGVPILLQLARGGSGGGVAHWAHVGGLLCGVAYAFLIRSQDDGRVEYLVDSTRASLDHRHAGNALDSAQQVVAARPDDPVGYQLLAEALDSRGHGDKALENYKIALDKHLRQGEQGAAAKMYRDALLRHADWVPEPPVLFALAGQMARDGDWRTSAESLAKIPYLFPDAAESEMALLRAGQMYFERLGEPLVAMQLLDEFRRRYPDSQWMPQATRLHEAASHKHAGSAA